MRIVQADTADLATTQACFEVARLAALDTASGAMAAVTAVEADPDNPEWGHQLLTAVTR